MVLPTSTIAVISLNCAFGLLNVGLCWQFWCWRRACRKQRRQLQAVEQTIHAALTTTALTLKTQQLTSKTWRSRVYQLQIYIHNLRQLLQLLVLLQTWSAKLR
ncbi:MAG: hypothetical protein F6J87_21250 [Spirulina sp. SIO3F2]|nr:hypothetical protein [Spirulina sp. SIO3F2]